MTDAPRRVLVCDDHPMVRQSLGATVQRLWPDAEVLEAGDFPTAWAMAERLPDLSFVDLGMPGAAPVDGIAQLLARQPRMRCLVITGSDENATAAELAAIGVAGLVRKTATTAVIEAAAVMVARGGRYLPAHVLMGPPRTAAEPAVVPTRQPLTDRQREVLRLMATGLSNKAIAKELSIAPETVKKHAAQIFDQLGAINRADACMRGRALGLI